MGFRLVGLLPERMPRIGAAHDHPPLFRLQHDVRAVPEKRAGRVKNPLHIDIDTILVDELVRIRHPLITGNLLQLHGHTRKTIEIVSGVVQGANPAFPNLHPGIRHRGGHFRIGELHPGVHGKRHVGMVDVGCHLDVLGDQHFDVRIDVLHHVIVVFGIVENVDVHHPANFAGTRHMRLAGEHLPPVLRRIDDQRVVAVIPIARLLAIIILAVLDLLAVHVILEVQIPRILPQIDARPGAGPGGCLPNTDLVVAGPGMAAGAEFSDVARQHHDQRRRPSHRCHMEVVANPFAVVDGSGLHRPAIPRPTDDEILRGPVDLVHCIQVVVLEMNRVHLVDGHDVDFTPVQQLHPIGAGQRRVDPGLSEMQPDLLTM